MQQKILGALGIVAAALAVVMIVTWNVAPESTRDRMNAQVSKAISTSRTTTTKTTLESSVVKPTLPTEFKSITNTLEITFKALDGKSFALDSKNSYVVILQKLLNTLDKEVELTGVYDEKTAEAVNQIYPTKDKGFTAETLEYIKKHVLIVGSTTNVKYDPNNEVFVEDNPSLNTENQPIDPETQCYISTSDTDIMVIPCANGGSQFTVIGDFLSNGSGQCLSNINHGYVGSLYWGVVGGSITHTGTWIACTQAGPQNPGQGNNGNNNDAGDGGGIDLVIYTGSTGVSDPSVPGTDWINDQDAGPTGGGGTGNPSNSEDDAPSLNNDYVVIPTVPVDVMPDDSDPTTSGQVVLDPDTPFPGDGPIIVTEEPVDPCARMTGVKGFFKKIKAFFKPASKQTIVDECDSEEEEEDEIDICNTTETEEPYYDPDKKNLFIYGPGWVLEQVIENSWDRNDIYYRDPDCEALGLDCGGPFGRKVLSNGVTPVHVHRNNYDDDEAFQEAYNRELDYQKELIRDYVESRIIKLEHDPEKLFQGRDENDDHDGIKIIVAHYGDLNYVRPTASMSVYVDRSWFDFYETYIDDQTGEEMVRPIIYVTPLRPDRITLNLYIIAADIEDIQNNGALENTWSVFSNQDNTDSVLVHEIDHVQYSNALTSFLIALKTVLFLNPAIDHSSYYAPFDEILSNPDDSWLYNQTRSAVEDDAIDNNLGWVILNEPEAARAFFQDVELYNHWRDRTKYIGNIERRAWCRVTNDSEIINTVGVETQEWHDCVVNPDDPVLYPPSDINNMLEDGPYSIHNYIEKWPNMPLFIPGVGMSFYDIFKHDKYDCH